MVLNTQTCSVYQKDGCLFFRNQFHGECNTLSHSARRPVIINSSKKEVLRRGKNVPNFLPLVEAVWLRGSVLELGLR